ncbi:MAG: MBL fold metallo-hydrolase [Alistipes sp.]|nr:MBL fold metallo-hydrolase [Alistipes sp.]
MELTFLGTGTSQGVPMIACDCEVCRSTDPRDKRLRTSALVRVGRGADGDSGCAPDGGPLNIVIDAGPDFRGQMLAADVRRLDAILLTHEHKDHTGGIDDVRAYNYFGQTPIDIWATERVQESVRRDYAYVFDAHPYPGAPEIALHTIPDGPFSVKGVEVIPINGLHMKLPVTGFRIGGLAYITDFNHIDDAEVEKLRGVDTLVVNAVGHKPHISHFNLEQAIDLGRRAGARRTFITHMAHRLGRYADIEPKLPDGVHLAYDNLTITV